MNENFINPSKNDEFVKLRGLDLQSMIVQVENYLLEYRDSLGLPQDLTFGVEIEYEGIMRKIANRFVEKKLPDWNSKRDGSLSSGGEIISPILNDDQKNWEELKVVCDYLTKKKADTVHNAGGHIHIGATVLDTDLDAWKSFIKLYTIYEHVLFRFAYGDKISARKKLYKFAPPTADMFYGSLKEINEAKSIYEFRCALPSMGRYTALNLNNVSFYDSYDYKNTIEFRSPNATTDKVIWQNNINTFSKMLISSKQKVMDEDFLDYKLRNDYMEYSTNKYLYDIVNIKDALEFVDLVFDNNLDKIYFLRQYLKDFKEGYGFNTAVKSKRFVKGR